MKIISIGFLVAVVASSVGAEEMKTLFQPYQLSQEEIVEFEALQEELTGDTDGQFVVQGWPNLELVWRQESVPVCWENPTEDNRWFRSIVRQAALDSWEAHSAVTFSGWETCAENSLGIRIQIADSGPHTKGLGTRLNGVRNGMVLNASYLNWSPSCQNQLSYCSYVIAVHEFGHALGFAHEQNRPDTPSHCDMAQGSDGSPETVSWTPWDEKSVMNYCNPQWSNGGKLSKWDIFSVQRLYGLP